MIHNPFIPGTYWALPGGRYFIDHAGRFAYASGPHIGQPAPVVPDTRGAIQLHLDTLPGGDR